MEELVAVFPWLAAGLAAGLAAAANPATTTRNGHALFAPLSASALVATHASSIVAAFPTLLLVAAVA